MSEIAASASISKSLLFYYFLNKKELYMYLWDYCSQITMEYLKKYNCSEQKNLFDGMVQGMKAKMEIIKLYPDMARFTIKAFYEKDEEICASIQESYHKHFSLKASNTILNLNPNQFREGIDLNMMYKDMYFASEGYLWEMVQRGNVDYKKMEDGFYHLIEFWKSIYLRKENNNEHN
ncbi:MAG: TetR/AcrR family transcriptional regulator [Erysipelotrichaceae bacterium]|nr:TetR/AcrR family transcriptional regulator [Erysipelotrichaceae bacterium]